MQSINLSPSPASQARDCLFDNIRFVLIFIVVFTHMLSPVSDQNLFAQILYEFSHLIIMPGFLFITGYFGKNTEKSRQTAVESFLMPYLFFQVLSFIIAIFREGKKWDAFNLISPRWGLWFLLVMFIYRILAKDFLRIRGILPLSILISLASGFFKSINANFSIGRTLGFLPFFILGLLCTREHIEKIRRLPKIIPVISLLLCIGFAVFICCNHQFGYTGWLNFSHHMLYFKESYHACNLTHLQGLIARASVILFSCGMIFSCIALFPRKKSYLSVVGQNTLPVYTLHLFILPYVKALKLFGRSGWDYLIFSAVFALALVLLLSSAPVVRAYHTVEQKLSQMVFKSPVS